MFCPKCGNQIEDAATVCMHCGQTVAEEKKTIPKIILIPGVILFAFCFIFAIVHAVNNIEFSSDNGEYPSSQFSSSTGSGTEESTVPVTTQSPEEMMQEYKNSCISIDYDTLARNPSNYKDQPFVLTGEVIQVLESANQTDLRINITAKTIGDSVYYSDTIYAVLYPEKGADRILEGDIITIWGDCIGLLSYESIFGQTISMPGITIAYYELTQ